MRFGHFDDHRREYVIERPDTPLPWINYLGSGDFLSLISNTAGGYAFYRDARLRRLTRFRYNNVPLDDGGRMLYLRDDRAGAFWSPSGAPTRVDLESYTCRHGLGYTVIASRYAGIDARLRFFVPPEQHLEVWDLTLTNTRAEAVELSLFGCVEFCLWDAWDDATNFQRNYNTGEVEVRNGVIYHKTEYRERRNHFAYFACSEPPVGFDTQRAAFLGRGRGWDEPLAVVQGLTSDSIAYGWAPIAAQHVRLSLLPGAQVRVAFLLGYHENPAGEKFDPPDSQQINTQNVEKTIARYLVPQQIDRSFQDLRELWDGYRGSFQVQTPDEHTNRMVDIWNPYQCMATFNLSRSASYFESGVGRGMGFRDSNQDLLGFVHMVPSRARERVLDLAATQLESGGAYHQYQPLTKRGNDAIGSGFNDDPLWLVLSVAAYLKETGDWSILNEPVPYENEPGSETPLYEHLERAVGYTLDRLGPHGLPLIGRADWNDCLNLNTYSETPGESFQTTETKDGRTAESVFIAGLFVLAAEELAEIASRHQGDEVAERYRQAARRMAATTLKSGWDGSWFLRAYDDAGAVVGGRECVEGQIFIESQGICGMAGIGLETGEAARALEAVHERLATRHGIALHQPAYTRYYLNLGEISSYPPGYKENAGVFCHTNPWVMIADARLGNGERAFQTYLRINPSARESISEVHGCEPYVYAQMIAGPDAPTFGEAKNSWLTGTAAWNYVAITQWILGVRPTHDGLRVAPVIPPAWEGFRARRVFRGVTYRIQVRREGPGNEVHLSADGQALEGTVVPLPPAGVEEVEVEVVLR